MANSISARKRIKQNEKQRQRNRARKSQIKTETRKLLDAIHQGEVQVARDALSRVQKQFDQVAAKGAIHKNTVARRKSRLARKVNAIAVTGKPA